MNNKELYDKILKAANIIHEKTIRGNGNYMIVNSEIATSINHINILEERKSKIGKILKRMKNNKKYYK